MAQQLSEQLSTQNVELSSPERSSVTLPPSAISVHSKWHTDLKEFEASRRSTFQFHTESLTLYWKSCCNLLEAGVHETAKAHRLVAGVAVAHGRIAKDVQGTAGKEQKPSSVELLVSLQEADTAMTQHFEASADELSECVTSIGNVLAFIRSAQSQVVADGQRILNLFAVHQVAVHGAWEAYLESASTYLDEVTTPVVGADGGGAAAAATATATDNTNHTPVPESSPAPRKSKRTSAPSVDVWLSEFEYRNCVANQNTAWENAATELEAVFVAAQEAECMRRINLREFMVEFVQQQQAPYRAVESTQAAALTDWVEQTQSRKVVLEQVKSAMQEQYRELGGKDKDAPSLVTDHVSVVKQYRGQFSPVLALKSEFLTNVFVMEQKPAGLSNEGTLVLAIVTTDAALHVFDLPSDKLSLESSPEEAFVVLFSMQEPPSFESISAGGSCGPWAGSLRPAASVELKHCTVKLIRKDVVVEIMETPGGSGQRILLGVSSRQERTAVLAALQHNAS